MCGKWQKVSTVVPLGSILDPLFFNIFINDLFLFNKTTALCNYADDNTMYSSHKNSDIVISRYDFAIISGWFCETYMALNPDNCHFPTLGFNKTFPEFSVEKIIIKNVNEEKILGIVIDNNLSFKISWKRCVKKLTKKSVHLQEFQN